jgi:hypothetical protein
MWLAVCLFAIGLAAIIGWALQRYRPSLFSRYPGGIEAFKRRGKIAIVICLAFALTMGALTSGNHFLVACGIAAIYIGGPLLAGVLMWWNHRLRWGKPGKARSPAEIQEALKRRRMQEAEQRQQRWQQVLDGLVFPYELVSGDQAEAAYEAARVKGQIEGYTPLIITPASLPMAPGVSGDQLMARARRIVDTVSPAQEFFAEQTAAWSRYDEDGERMRWLTEAPTFDAEPIEPARALNDRMYTLLDTVGEQRPVPYVREAALVRIPTPRSWEIPAYTLFGGWNACPGPRQIVAVARHWNEKYGADICALSSDTIEFRVERPPADLRQAFALLREHMLFCDEGFYDLIASPQYFREMLSQKYWLFWWD